MNDMRADAKYISLNLILLNLTRFITEKNVLPGRYVLSQQVAKLCSSKYPIVQGHIGSFQIDLNLQDDIQREIFFGIYDPDETALLKRLLRPGDIVFDIGANIGYYSLLASQLISDSGQVYTFEPIPENHQVLHEAIQKNNIHNIYPNLLAIGQANGSLDLYLPSNIQEKSGWASIVPSATRPIRISVKMTSIDEFIQISAIDKVRLIKIDIEGCELDALRGAGRLLARSDAPDLICEVNPYLLDLQGSKPRVLLDYLAEYSFRAYRITRSGLTALDPGKEITQVINIYCSKSDASF